MALLDVGRLRWQTRAFGKTTMLSAIGALGDSKLRFVDSGFRIARVLVLLALWRAVMPPDSTVNGFTIATLLTYTLIAESFADQLNATSGFGNWLWGGLIAGKLTQPFSLIGQAVAALLGSWIFSLVSVSIPILLISPLLGVDPRPANLAALLWFVPSLLLAISVGLAIDILLGISIAAFDLTPWLVDLFRLAAAAVLAGAVIPLAILPWGLGNLFQWTPFASMASAPLLIYTGIGSVGFLVVLQIAWSVVLWSAAGLLWHRSREKLVSYGG